MRAFGKNPLCTKATQAILGVKQYQWNNIKKSLCASWRIGSFTDHAFGQTRKAWTFEGYGGVEVLRVIVNAIAKDFSTYSPGRYRLIYRRVKEFHFLPFVASGMWIVVAHLQMIPQLFIFHHPTAGEESLLCFWKRVRMSIGVESDRGFNNAKKVENR